MKTFTVEEVNKLIPRLREILDNIFDLSIEARTLYNDIETLQEIWGKDVIQINNPDNKSLLILDDIGVERVSDFVLETLYRVINYRYVNMLPTIFTSNLNIQELADKIGDRSVSRIVEMCGVVELTGSDRRLN